MSDAHTFYIVMSYAAVAIAIVAEILAVRARQRRAIELARNAPPQTIPNPTGSA
jgi:heme exporter protein CcmD